MDPFPGHTDPGVLRVYIAKCIPFPIENGYDYYLTFW